MGLGLSRCLDYLETDATVDAKRIAVMGSSVSARPPVGRAFGRTLRFGHLQQLDGGAALSRRKFGETVCLSTPPFPIGFVTTIRNTTTRKRVSRGPAHADCIVRTSCRLARRGDRRMIQMGISVCPGAKPVYKLFGHKFGAPSNHPLTTCPRTDCYHVRTGKYDVTPYDWDQYLDFADKH